MYLLEWFKMQDDEIWNIEINSASNKNLLTSRMSKYASHYFVMLSSFLRNNHFRTIISSNHNQFYRIISCIIFLISFLIFWFSLYCLHFINFRVCSISCKHLVWTDFRNWSSSLFFFSWVFCMDENSLSIICIFDLFFSMFIKLPSLSICMSHWKC